MEANRYLCTLGGLSLHQGGPDGDVLLRQSKSLAVLAYVAMAPGREASRQHLASLLWPDSDAKRARRSLRQALYYLSKQAGTELLRSDDGKVRVAEERLAIDAWAFDRALEEDEPERAVELYRGPFLEGFGADGGREFESWVESQNERIWAGLKAAYHGLVTRALEEDEPERAVRYAREYVEVNPLDEKARRMVIRAHLAAGDRVAAYRAYEEYRTLLAEELEVEPGPELRERMEALRDSIFGAAAEGPVPDPEGVEGRGPVDASAPLTVGEITSTEEAAEAAGEASAARTWWVAALAAAVGFLAATVVFVLSGEAGSARGSDWRADGRLMVHTRGDDSRVELAVRGGEVTGRRAGEWFEQPGPAGRRVAKVVRAEDGVDVAVLDRETGDTLFRTRRPADELPLDWAPDGSRLLIMSGRPSEGAAGYRYRVEVLDLEHGDRRDLGLVSMRAGRPDAAWSPRGDRIAVSLVGPEGRDVWVVDADGSDSVRITDHPAVDRRPAWRPGGGWLAFDSGRGPTRDLYLVRADGTGLEQLTRGPEDEFAPAWLSERHLAHAAGPEGAAEGRGEHELWLVDVPTLRSRRLATGLRVWSLRRAFDARLGEAQIREVRIEGDALRVSPGQRLRLTGTVLTRGGDTLSPGSVPLRWTVDDSSVVRVDSDGRGTVLGTGEATVVASAGGWRADTLRVVSRPPEVRDSPVVLSETWTAGIRSDRWRTFGEPPPRVEPLEARRRGGGPPGPGGPYGNAAVPPAREAAETGERGLRAPSAAFVNNGDANFDSGVVSRERFSLAHGLTIEFLGRFPFSGRRYEAVKIGLVTSLLEPGAGDLQAQIRLLGGVVLARPSIASHVWVGGSHVAELPELTNPRRWRRYAVQLEPDGRVSWVVDGEIRWRSRPGLLADRPDSARVVVGGRSLHADLMVGPVTVRRGVRWSLED